MSLVPPTPCIILIALLLTSGCATSRYQPSTTVSEVDGKACEKFAQSEVDAIEANLESAGGAFVRGFGGASDAAGRIGLIILSPILSPIGGLAEAVSVARENENVRQDLYAKAMEACLEPPILEQTLGPEHPDVALSLQRLAELYSRRGKIAEAEPLYERALAIREKAIGPEHPDLATTLVGYADLLRRLNRNREAAQMEARVEAIWSRHLHQRESRESPDHSVP